MSYEAWMFVHLAGVIVFFANFVAAFFWRTRAERTADPLLLAYTYRTLNAGDAWLTTPSVAAILAGGVGAALGVGLPIIRTPWVLWSLVSFAISGLIFVLRVLPLQRALAAQAEEGVRTGHFDIQAHRRRARVWAFWAHVSFLAAAAPVPLMVFKPMLSAP
jgi:uncharacterized membrane protein